MMTRTSLSLGQVSVFIVPVLSADNEPMITIYFAILGQVCRAALLPPSPQINNSEEMENFQFEETEINRQKQLSTITETSSSDEAIEL